MTGLLRQGRHVLSGLLYRYGWDTRCRNLFPARELRPLLTEAASRSRPALLDVGCGRLGLATFLGRIAVVGLDVQPPPDRVANFTFVSSDALALPFRDRAFFAVSCVDVLEHLAPHDRVRAIRECLRVAHRVVLLAFPSGPHARRCDVDYHRACERHSRPLPDWVDEHLRHEYPEDDTVLEQLRAAAAQMGYTVRIRQSYCEPLVICRLVRAAATYSTWLYALVNGFFGVVSPCIPRPDAHNSYRTILLAELSPNADMNRSHAQAPLVSVVIPNYNYARHLGGAIESVLAQSYPNVEVIVVDDGSSDDSEAVLRRYGDRIRWLRQPRQGVAAARNRGVEVSGGELVAFLDADDCWLPLKLERQVERWRTEAGLGLVHCAARMIDRMGHTVRIQRNGLEGWIAKELLLFRRLVVVCTGSTALIPRAVFDEVGGFDPRLSTSADWDLCYRIASRYRVAFVPEELICWRIHQTNMHANIRVMEHDMLLAYAKAFQQAGPEIRRLRRQSYGNLHMVLGGSFFRAGQPLDAVRHILKSLWLTPANSIRLFRFPMRWWRRRGFTHRRPLATADPLPDLRPRVLYISYDGLLEPLGQSQIIPYLLGLASRGAVITLLSFEKRADQRRSGRVRSLRATLSAHGIQWIDLTYHKRPTLVATAFDLLVGTLRAWGCFRRDRIQVVHARSDVAALMAWVLKRLLRVRFIFDMRGFWADERVDGGFWSPTDWLYRMVKRLERIFLEEADEIVTLTEQARRIIESWLGPRCPRITVIPTCVDLDRFQRLSQPNSTGEEPVFIYTGSVGTWYGVPELFEFVEWAVARFPDARLLLLTRQTQEAAWCLAQSSLRPDVVTIASADAAAIPHWLAQAHAGLAFYKPGFSRQGTCPTKMGEYLAAGLPVVVTAGVGDVETLIGSVRVGAVLSAFSPEAYGRALDVLEQLWADPELPARCRTAAEASFSLPMGIERYWAMYERLTGRPERPEEETGVSPMRDRGPAPQAAGMNT